MAPVSYDDAEWQRLTDLARARARKWDLGSEDAGDIAQDTMVKLHRQHPLPDNPDAWVTRVVDNAVIDHWRKTKRPQGDLGGRDRDADRHVGGPREIPYEGYEDEAHELRLWLDRAAPVSAAGMRSEAMRYLRDRLAAVLTEQEIAVVQKVADDVPYEQIAADLGYRNADVVKTTVRRIRQKVAELDREGLDVLRGHPRPYGPGGR